MRPTLYVLFYTAVFFCCFTINGSAQKLWLRMNQAAKATSKPATTAVLQTMPPTGTTTRGFIAPAAENPTISDFSPKAAGAGTPIDITGTNFDAKTIVSFGGVRAASVTVTSNTQLVAIVGPGATGPVTVGTAATPNTDSKDGFAFASQPTIASVNHTLAGNTTTIVIVGTNFVSPSVAINGGGLVSDPGITISADFDTIHYSMPGSAILTDILVKTPGGEAELSAGKPVTGTADLNLPDFGNGLTVVPTPSLDYSQIYLGRNTAFSERLWGNSLPTDSTRQKMGAKLLMPQISLFGLNFDIARRFTNQTSPVNFGAVLECNFLIKKVSDTTNKPGSNFNPAVFHPRLGLTSSFFHDNVYVAVFANFLTVVGSNDAFSAYFNTRSKNVFVFPEIDFGGLLSVGASGNQALKFDLNLIVNNGDAQFLSGTHDVIVPSLRIGFVTTL